MIRELFVFPSRTVNPDPILESIGGSSGSYRLLLLLLCTIPFFLRTNFELTTATSDDGVDIIASIETLVVHNRWYTLPNPYGQMPAYYVDLMLFE